MESILSGFQAAFYLIAGLNQELLGIILLSLEVSGLALILSALLGLPLAALMGLKQFPARGILVTLLNTFMGLPPVVVGLFLYLLLSRSGPLGFLSLLYTPSAMIIAQSHPGLSHRQFPRPFGHRQCKSQHRLAAISPRGHSFADGLDHYQRSPLWHHVRGHRRIRTGHGRGGVYPDRRREYCRVYPGHDHDDRPGNRQRQF